jgi:hypothetical protein
MDENSTKKILAEDVKMNKFTDALKLSDSTKKLMESFNKISAIPDFSLPQPEVLTPIRFPTQQEINKYQSASVLMEALSKEALRWKKQLPENYKPAILALLFGGLQINVHSLSQVSFHGIQIEGTLNGAPCSLLAHQSTVQMLCYGEEITEETPSRPIGFIWTGHNVQV